VIGTRYYSSDVEDDPIEEWPLTALLRGATASVGATLRESLVGSDLDDLPPNGAFVIAAIPHVSQPLGSLVRRLGGSKQAAGQLVDTLVTRGYLERSVDPDDRRRLIVRLTRRGEEAATRIRSALDRLESELSRANRTDRVQDARVVLASLVRNDPTDG
jgi:DNA-binding MarR family transcriptional regulator